MSQTTSPPAEQTGEAFRRVMGQLATGVVVLTTCDRISQGITLSSFTSVSLDPPMVLVCVQRTARINEAISRSGCFAVSVLSQSQTEVARFFADHRRHQAIDPFAGFPSRTGVSSNAPLIDGAVAYLECELTGSVEGGDHLVHLGSVLATSLGSEGPPLTFHAGRFSTLAGAP